MWENLGAGHITQRARQCQADIALSMACLPAALHSTVHRGSSVWLA